jgi:LacI family transcriptional regulator
MPGRRSVALLIETSNAYARGLLDGIIAYQREHELWSIYVGEQQRGARPPDWMKNWRGDGIIARIETDAIAAVVRRGRLPTVDVSAARRVANIPWVETNDDEIARLAARHLIDRGFRTLAYCGEPQLTGRDGVRNASWPSPRKRDARAASSKAAPAAKGDTRGRANAKA